MKFSEQVEKIKKDYELTDDEMSEVVNVLEENFLSDLDLVSSYIFDTINGFNMESIDVEDIVRDGMSLDVEIAEIDRGEIEEGWDDEEDYYMDLKSEIEYKINDIFLENLDMDAVTYSQNYN